MKIHEALREAAEKCAADPAIGVQEAIGLRRTRAQEFFEGWMTAYPEEVMYSYRVSGAERPAMRVTALLLAAELAGRL